MYAVFGMTRQLARRRVKVSMKNKGGTFKTAQEHEAEVEQKIDALMAGQRSEQLSGIYGVRACAEQFASLAVASGGAGRDPRPHQ